MGNLTKQQIEQLAQHLEDAELQAYEVTKITDDFPDMSYEDAFDIQWEIRRRKEKRGNKIVGMKMGLTSWAKMAQMGVEKPCYGFLADYFGLRISDGNKYHIPAIFRGGQYLVTQFNCGGRSGFIADLYCYALGHKIAQRLVI
ncbi:MAG: 2-oxo-3-hexenedioate decarboxylase [Paraglaciecola sp.]|jgi:2-oxo-3-hexenedioate decarboxylase